jgi:hypothetical protein
MSETISNQSKALRDATDAVIKFVDRIALEKNLNLCADAMDNTDVTSVLLSGFKTKAEQLRDFTGALYSKEDQQEKFICGLSCLLEVVFSTCKSISLADDAACLAVELAEIYNEAGMAKKAAEMETERLKLLQRQ